MTEATSVELSIEGLKKYFDINDRQAKLLLRWIVAKRTRKLVRREESAEEVFQAQRGLKAADVFPGHDERLDIMRKAEVLFLE